MAHIKYTTIFFDWGGVIADDPGDEFFGQLMRSIGASETQVKEIFETYMRRFMRGQISESEYWQELRSRYGFSIPDSISKEFKKWRGLVANQDILALVSEARDHGFKVAILSNVIEPSYKAIDQAAYYQIFDEVIASCQVGYAKPDKEIYQIALDRLKVSAPESIFIDDKQLCLTPAADMGFTTILAQNPTQIIKDVRSYF